MVKHYIWSYNPIDIDAYMYDYIANKNNFSFVNFYENGMTEERKSCGYSLCLQNYTAIHTTYDEAVDVVKNCSDTIHIFFGLLTPMNRRLLRYLKDCKRDNKIFIVSERYNAFGNSLEKRAKELIRWFDYKKLSRELNNVIDGFFAYGTKGAEFFKKLGFTHVSPTMYATNHHYNIRTYTLLDAVHPPAGHASRCALGYSYSNRTEKTRFIYVGRLEFDLKGVDILLKSLDTIIHRGGGRKEWSIDFVGNYGANSADVNRWIDAHCEYARQVGKIPFDQMIHYLHGYDVCIIPSRKEGYHTLPAQCIAAGIACIVTKGCVSDELIERYKSGIVVSSGDGKQLSDAIMFCITDKEAIDKMKRCAEQAAPDISMEAVGDYMWSVIQCRINKSSSIPECPWSKKIARAKEHSRELEREE